MVEKIKITFLGTGGPIPTAKRNHSAFLLTYLGENILVDCGEGTQRQFRRAKISPIKLTKLLITHWHGDHVLGLPGLFQTLSFSNYNKQLQIYGPKGINQHVNDVLKAFPSVKNVVADVKFKVQEGKGVFFENGFFYLEAKKLFHGTPTNAYNFVIKDRVRIDKKKLEKSKLPAGPLLSKLVEGKDVSYDGEKFKAKDLTYVEKGKKVSFVFDTGFDKSIINFVKGADVLVIEATYADELKELAKEHAHLTAKQAGEIAKKAKVGKMYLSHLSERYEKDMNVILKEAKKIFKNSFLAKDLESLEI